MVTTTNKSTKITFLQPEGVFLTQNELCNTLVCLSVLFLYKLQKRQYGLQMNPLVTQGHNLFLDFTKAFDAPDLMIPCAEAR